MRIPNALMRGIVYILNQVIFTLHIQEEFFKRNVDIWLRYGLIKDFMTSSLDALTSGQKYRFPKISQNNGFW